MLDRNIRGIDIALCLLTLLLSLSGCGSLKDDTLLIVNAVITEVDATKADSLFDQQSNPSPEGGIAPGTPWSEVPEDFECPLCGVGKDSFEEA